MRSNKIIYFSTSFAAFFMAVFMIGSINQSDIIQEKSSSNDPTVVSTYPSDGEDEVARNIVIEVTFSDAIDSMSMQHPTLTLMQGNETVPGTMEFSGNKGMFTTQKSLKAQTEYTAKITSASNQSDDHSNEEFNNEEFNDEEYDYRTSAENDKDKEWSFTTGGNSDPVETVDLGNAAGFVILAQSAINNEESSDITGEKGFDPEFKSSKENKTAYWLKNEDVDKEAVRRDTTRKKSNERDRDRDYTTTDRATDRDSNTENLDEALEDMITAYEDAAERSPVDFIDYKFTSSSDKKSDREEDLNGVYDHTDDNTDNPRYGIDYDNRSEMDQNRDESSVTLEPGIYKWNESVEISNNITLSGNAEDVWIFQIPEGLTVSRDVEITLSDGAVADNIFWQVGGDVSIGESSHFEGIILSLNAITMKNGATLNGRMLAQTDVTLDDNTISDPKLLATAQRTSRDEE